MANPYALTPQELLARTIYAEAGNQPLAGQIGVGAVVNNRIASPNFPSSYHDTILANRQFSPFNAYNDGTGSIPGPAPASVNELAARIIAGDYEDPTGGALNFANPEYSDASNLPWIHGMSNQVQIGDHLFGTAGAGTRGGGGMNARMSFRNEQGADSQQPQSRVGKVLGKVFPGFGSNNPTISAKRLANMADIHHSAADRSMRVFEGDAPASWLNVLGTTAQRGVAHYLAGRSENEEARGRDTAMELFQSGQMDDATIAKIMSLDPELGRTLLNRRYSIEDREDDQAFRSAEAARQREFTADQAEEQLVREKELARFTNGLPTDEINEIKQLLQEMGVNPEDEDYNQIFQREHAQRFDKARSTTDNRTAIMKNLEAMGLVPGSEEYEKAMAAHLAGMSSPEVKAALINANKFGASYGTEHGRSAAGLAGAAAQAEMQLRQWETARQHLENFTSGALSPVQMQAGRLASSLGLSGSLLEELGVDPTQVASMEVVEQIVNRSIIGMIGTSGDEGGFPANNFSNADLQFLVTAVPGLTNTMQGLSLKMAMMQWQDSVTVAKANYWVKTINEAREADPSWQPDSVFWENFQHDWRNSEEFKALDAERFDTFAFEKSANDPVTIQTEEDYEQLPNGTVYVDPNTGETVVKGAE